MNPNFIKHIRSSVNHISIITGITFLIALISMAPADMSAQNRMDTTAEDTTVLRINRDAGFIKSIRFEMLSVNGKITPRPSVMSGYRVSPNFSAGIGIGFTHYNEPLSLIPLFIDLNYKILNSGITPFASFKVGYSFSVQTEEDARIDNHSGGIMINPGTGLHFKLADKLGLLLHIGFNIYHADFERRIFRTGTFREDLTYKRLNFGAGLAF